MQPTKKAAKVTQTSIVAPAYDTATDIIAPTNVEIIEPVFEIEISEEETEHLEKEFILREEINQYHHLAYSQY